jgi:translation initiation factor 4A
MNSNREKMNTSKQEIKEENQDLEIIQSNWNEEISSFDELELKEDLLRGIYAYGFEKPSPIQQKAIKPTIMGKDIIAQAQSGTGKTGTFGISVLERIDTNIDEPQALILAPTRELVEQITGVISNIGTFIGVKVEGFVGGKATRDDIIKLRSGIHVVVGTPGRIEDLINRNALKLGYIKIFVLDEADEMLSKGFVLQVQKIVSRLDESAQIALFSATLTNEVKQITQNFMKPDAVRIYIPVHQQTLDGIPQYVIQLEENQKFDVIIDLYEKLTLGTTIIFCNSIRSVDWLADKLTQKDFTVSTIHGGMTQSEREDKLLKLRKGATRLLITTDILSRGIDVQQLSMVVNYDLPFESETYIHRIGRCGRFGRKGLAINLVGPKDFDKVAFIESHYKTKINPLPSNLDNLVK